MKVYVESWLKPNFKLILHLFVLIEREIIARHQEEEFQVKSGHFKLCWNYHIEILLSVELVGIIFQCILTAAVKLDQFEFK